MHGSVPQEASDRVALSLHEALNVSARAFGGGDFLPLFQVSEGTDFSRPAVNGQECLCDTTQVYLSLTRISYIGPTVQFRELLLPQVI
jgi:hypothetical protein